MNRHERRRAAKTERGDVTNVSLGHLQQRDPNYGVPVNCYVCGAPHKALGLARISDKSGATDVPICDACLCTPQADQRIMRKYWNAPDLTVRDGGKATTEQLDAIVEKLKTDATSH
jgi:hypothetical protein